jgi:hypothetical protein
MFRQSHDVHKGIAITGSIPEGTAKHGPSPYVTVVGWAELVLQASSSLAIGTIFRQRVDRRPDFEASILASPVFAKPLTFPFDSSSL